MWPLIRWLSIRHWLRKPLRTLMTAFGIALGVAVTVSVDLIGDEIVNAHRRTVDAVSGKAQLSVTRGEAGVPVTVVDQVLKVRGVSHAAPVLEQMVSEPGRGPLLLLGIDFLGDDALRSVDAVPEDEEVLDDPLAFLNSTNSLLVAKSFADRRGLTRDSHVVLSTPMGKKEFVIRGLVRDQGPARAFGGDVVVMYLDAAQIALGLGEVATRIDLMVSPGEELGAVRTRLVSALGAGYKVELPERRSARLEELMTGLKHALYTMAALAVWVGILLAYNAVEISVRQRKNELAILRAVGAERRHIVALVLLEACALGLLATPAGLALGWLLALRGVSETARLVSELVEVVKVDEIVLGGRHLISGIFVGVVIPVLGAIQPARWIIKEPPMSGLSRAVEELGEVHQAKRSMGWGVVATLVGLAVFASPWAAANTVLGYTGFALTLLGAVFLAPAVVDRLATLVQRAGRNVLSAEVIVALDHVVRDRRRAALNVASLVAGVATVLTVATYGRSFSDANRRWLDSALVSDLFVTSGSKLAIGENQPLEPRLGELLAAIPDVESIYPVRVIDFEHRGRPLKLAAVGGFRDYLQRARLLIVDGALDVDGLAAGTHLVVSESVARRDGYGAGDRITLDTPHGPRDFTVSAIIVHFLSDQGVILMDRDVYRGWSDDAWVDSFDMIVKRGVEPAVVRARVRELYGDKYNLYILSNRELKEESQRLINQLIALMSFLELVTLAIAVLGVATTLVAAVLDRTREIGVMRAVGTTPGQIVRIVLSEAALIGAAASLFGLVLGTAVGALFLRSVVVAAVGWSMPWIIPFSAYPAVLLGVIAASVVAGLYPAWRSARIPILDAIRAE